ncbi:MAG: MFS transporter [Actinomycetota bacterium]
MSPRNTLNETFSSLRVRNFRLFTIAQVVSISGTWMQTVAQALLVYSLAKSQAALAMGFVVALQFLPTALIGMWFGLLSDRKDKRKILVWTQSLMGVLAVVLGVLTLTHTVQLWMVYVLAILLGIVTAADTPARQAFVMEMVGRDEVANAIGLNSAVFNSGRIIGPALAAVAIGVGGLSIAFLLNGVSYVFPVIALLMMNRSQLERAQAPKRERGMLRKGVSYAWRTRKVRRVILMMTVISTIAFNYSVTVPLLGLDTFHGGTLTVGLLLAFTATGGLIGALWTAHRARPTQRLLAMSALIFGAFMLGVAFAPSVVLAGLFLVVAGGASMAFITTANSTLQLETPANMRGRIMAIYVLVFLGSTPVGAPIIGWICQHYGARSGFAVGAIATLVTAAIAIATLRGVRNRILGPTQQVSIATDIEISPAQSA